MTTAERVQFASKEEFREWLSKHGRSVRSVWLILGKKGGPKTVSAQEALEEALCFGWIDGQIRSVDETVYIKYFAQRRKGSVWSQRNKNLIESLENQGRMTDHGRAKVAEAKATGMWDSPSSLPITDEQAGDFSELLRGSGPAYSNFMAMSPSVRRTYTGFYRAAVSEETRARRLAQIIERLNKNLKPMQAE